ncbi:MAG TPA: hypothetical protein DEA22_12640 [Blastocatellia bacterium]|nr:hypothetical protein [Blastocatellia bacterium]
MDRKFWISGIACTIVAFALGFVVHGMLLRGDYAQLPNLFRPEAEAQGYFAYMSAAHIFIGFAFAWIYRQGITPGVPWLLQGIRFGVAVACLVTIPTYLIYYAVQPMPGMMVAKQIIFDGIAVILTGVVAAFINRE